MQNFHTEKSTFPDVLKNIFVVPRRHSVVDLTNVRLSDFTYLSYIFPPFIYCFPLSPYFTVIYIGSTPPPPPIIYCTSAQTVSELIFIVVFDFQDIKMLFCSFKRAFNLLETVFCIRPRKGKHISIINFKCLFLDNVVL